MSILSTLGLGKLDGKPKKSKSASEILDMFEKQAAAKKAAKKKVVKPKPSV